MIAAGRGRNCYFVCVWTLIRSVQFKVERLRGRKIKRGIMRLLISLHFFFFFFHYLIGCDWLRQHTCPWPRVGFRGYSRKSIGFCYAISSVSDIYYYLMDHFYFCFLFFFFKLRTTLKRYFLLIKKKYFIKVYGVDFNGCHSYVG